MSTTSFQSPAPLSGAVSESSYTSNLEHLYSADVATAEPHIFWSNSATKRAFDITVAAPLLVVSLPLLACIAVAVKVSSPGPALFRQKRMGKGQVPFTIYKYRTMNVSTGDGMMVTRRGDTRTTRIGCVLRRLKLDELPQLFNVLRGDMSLVGPRPKIVGHEKVELPCKPGITGMATLIFAYEEDLLAQIPPDQAEEFVVEVLHPIKARLDHRYAKEGTWWTDLCILVATVLPAKREKAVRTLADLSQWGHES